MSQISLVKPEPKIAVNQLSAALGFYVNNALPKAGWTIDVWQPGSKVLVLTMHRTIALPEADYGSVSFEAGMMFDVPPEGFAVLSNFRLEATKLPGYDSARASTLDCYLLPLRALAHCGKRFGIDQDDYGNQAVLDQVWVIRNAKSFQALLDAYDDLAHRAGYPTLFQPLGKAS